MGVPPAGGQMVKGGGGGQTVDGNRPVHHTCKYSLSLEDVKQKESGSVGPVSGFSVSVQPGWL